MVKRGFTIVELIITITIMGILMILAVVSVNSTQVRARDDERRVDIESISSSLETYYRLGDDTSTLFGRYPTTSVVVSETTIKQQLRDVNINSFIAPGQTVATSTFKAATNAIQTTAGVLPQPTISEYVYQPINTAGTLCTTGECRKYNLYYRTETDNTVRTVTSKNQ